MQTSENLRSTGISNIPTGRISDGVVTVIDRVISG
jgi:hypothetical protein